LGAIGDLVDGDAAVVVGVPAGGELVLVMLM
jgi:hypothetical protein